MSWLLDMIRAIFRVPDPTPPAAPPWPPPIPTTSPLVAAFNAERARAGLGPLADDPGLERSAASWAVAMAIAGRESHDGFQERVGRVYPGVPIGEIVAEGYEDIPSVLAAWMSSPPHRADILGPFDRAGAAMTRARDGTPYWAAQFCRVGGGR